MVIFLVYTFKEPALLARTIARMRPARFVVHVDAKVAQEPFEDAIPREDRERVHFLTNRLQVNWAGFSQLTAIRRMVQYALSKAEEDEYLMLLSGSDYPIKSLDTLEAHLRASGGRQFMHYFVITKDPAQRHYYRHIDHRHHRDMKFLSRSIHITALRRSRTALIKLLELADRRMHPLLTPESLPGGIAFGGTHFAVTASFIGSLEDQVTPSIESFFSKIFCPEEHFYQTLALNSSRAGETGGPLPGGAEPFKGIGTHKYANLHHIEPVLEKILTSDDTGAVLASKAFFARKFSLAKSQEILWNIDRATHNRKPLP